MSEPSAIAVCWACKYSKVTRTEDLAHDLADQHTCWDVETEVFTRG